MVRLKTHRDEQIAQKASAYEAEKLKWQSTLASLQKQMDAPQQMPLDSAKNTDGIQLDEGLILEIPNEDEEGTENK